MNAPNQVVEVRVERTEPIHISAVISELLAEYAARQEVLATSATGLLHGRLRTASVEECQQVTQIVDGKDFVQIRGHDRLAGEAAMFNLVDIKN